MRAALRSERGFTFIEIIISIALIGIIAGGFLSALAASSRNTQVSDERGTAESLARSEIEYVRDRDYLSAEWQYDVGFDYWSTTYTSLNDLGYPHNLSEIYDGYVVRVDASAVHMIDDGIQKITVTVYHGAVGAANQVYSLEDYKTI